MLKRCKKIKETNYTEGIDIVKALTITSSLHIIERLDAYYK